MRRRTRLAAVLAFATASCTLALLEYVYRPYAEQGLYFHAWTSEYMMQTLSVADLRAEPLRSLFYLHIQPPAFDAIRALLVARHHGLRATALLRAVDSDLYVLWLLAAGAMAALTAHWVARSEGAAAGWLASLLLALSPGVIFYATFLDSTLLSALLLLWFYYELARLASGAGSPARFGASLVSLFLTRAAFQWPFLAVCAAALRLVGLSWRRALQVLWAPTLLTALFLAKQYAVFGLGVTSSFGPDSWCKGLMEYCHGRASVTLPELPDPRRASALRRTRKLGGHYNYNQIAFLRRSFSQMEEYKELLRQRTLGELVGVAAHNAGIYLRPTSRHSPHVIVDRLAWRRPYEALFAGAPLSGLLAAAGVVWLRRAGAGRQAVARAVGMALPALYVAAVSIVFESGENMRYRFFLEPVCFVFLSLQTLAALRSIRGRASGASQAPA